MERVPCRYGGFLHGGAPNHPNLEKIRLETNGFGDPPF